MTNPPIERTWPIKKVAELLQVSPRTIHRLLFSHPDKFRQPPRYRRLGGHPRKHRVLTRDEIVTLQSFIMISRGWADNF